MKISTVQSLRPFSHTPGTSLILPGSFHQLEIFPCLIRVYSLSQTFPELTQEIHLDLKGPIHEFTIWCDLENGKVTVRGKSQQGWFRYHLVSSKVGNHIFLVLDRAPIEGVRVKIRSVWQLLHRGVFVNLISENNVFDGYQPPQCLEKLFLGNNKAQDIDLIRRRLDLTEIFPLWHRLGQMIPQLPVRNKNDDHGMFSLLKHCQEIFFEKKPEKGKQEWLNLFQAGFEGIFVPRLEDHSHLGFIEESIASLNENSPLYLLIEGSSLIRQLFLQEEKNQLFILPHLLPELHCGRLLNIDLNGLGRVSLEWSKKTIRCLALHSEKDQEIEIIFRSNVRSYRLRTSNKDPGERLPTKTSLMLKQNCDYFFDNFM
ncbi:MAG: hypothetical protein Q8K60_06550 [Parachlamydiaceae bacterium]|nr:hypothetical protein [Parachlamydiaceae bacterium]